MIEGTGLSMVFNRGTPLENLAVSDVDLSIAEGEFVTMIGTNGSGKSTLLKMISGELQSSSGSLSIDGVDVTTKPHHERARHVAQVFQDPLAGTCAGLSIEENLALAAMRGKRRGFRLAVTRARRAEFAERLAMLGMGLEKRLEDQVGLLSGGQRQALSLLMCTLTPCKVLLLDEHTAALDPRMSEFILKLTDELYRQDKLTVLMVTHSLSDSLAIGDRTIMMHRGSINLDLKGSDRDAADATRLFTHFAETT